VMYVDLDPLTHFFLESENLKMQMYGHVSVIESKEIAARIIVTLP
jgi:hypothetical protein